MVIPPQPRILILGSIPGDRSLQLQEYYGHPQNRFWKVVARLCNEETPQDYKSKKELLARHHIALWDVAGRAQRIGSLDSAIRNEEPNNILQLLTEHGCIEHIIFNGKKAEQLYQRYFERLPHIHYWSMPSTSPANAASGMEALIVAWEKAIIL